MKQYTLLRPRLKKTIGITLVVIGFIALVTPLTPGGFLFIIGLELLGIRFLFFDKLLRRKPAVREE